MGPIVQDIEWFSPERLYLFEYEGQRWFTDSYSMVPVRRFSSSLPGAPGRYARCIDDEGLHDYTQIDAEWDPAKAVERLGHGVPRNSDRRDSQLLMWPDDDDDPMVIVYERNAGALMNRLYLEVVQFIAERVIDGFGVGGPETQVTLYSGDELVGFIMPVRAKAIVGPALIPLGAA